MTFKTSPTNTVPTITCVQEMESDYSRKIGQIK